MIPGSRDKPITLDLFYEIKEELQPLVIFCHGFKGFKDWGHFDLVARAFAREGLIFLKFNFSHNGTTAADPGNFGDLEAFANNNYIIELGDVQRVIDWSLDYPELKPILDRQKIYLLGHSRGGGIAIVKAAEDKRVKKLVTWASVSNFTNRNKKKTIDTWKRDKVIYAHNARTGQDMPMYLQFYEIMMANKDRLNVLKAARSLKVPFLIVHGTSDEAVPVLEAEMLHRSAKKSVLLKLEGASHSFGARHPFIERELPADADTAIQSTIEFLKKSH